MNKIVAIIFSVAIIVAAFFLAQGYSSRGEEAGVISVTGLGSVEFQSDEIIWEGTFEKNSDELSSGFDKIRADRAIIENYLVNRGLESSEFSFSQISTDENYRTIYNAQGNYQGNEFKDYSLRQSFKISSKKLDLVEQLAREISELLNEGVNITSYNPKYYYSELDELKIDLIEKASENGRLRAEQIASNGGAEIAGLKDARLGVFQILGKNSAEDYSWGGTFNTSSRMKEANITVKMDYEVE